MNFRLTSGGKKENYNFLTMKNLSSFHLIIIFLLFPYSVHALPPDQTQSAIEQQQQIQRQQEQQLQQQQRQQELERIQKESPMLSPDLLEKTNGAENQTCFLITKIAIDGVTLLSNKEIAQLKKPYLNSCMNVTDINNLVRDITNIYIRKGYITSRAAVPIQNLKSNILKIKVIEGTVEDLQINENNLRDKMQLFTAFPFIKNKHLNLKDIEQGLEQMNRLESNDATIILAPGQQNGSSIVQFANKQSDNFRIAIGYDNSGQKSTGENKKNLTITKENLLSLNDIWNINISRDHMAPGHTHSRSNSLSFSIPYGYWTLTTSASHSTYLTTIEGSNVTFDASGETTNYQAILDRMLYRDQRKKISLETSIALKDTKSFIEDVQSNSGSRKLTIAEISLPLTIYHRLGTLYTKLGYHRGLKLFNALEDSDNLALGAEHAQFDLVKLYLYFNKKFKLFKTNIPVNFTSSFDSQLSNDELYSSESLALGGQYSIRGFKESSIQGDSGFISRNELSVNMNNIINYGVFKKTKLGIFYDYGFARPRGAINKGYMSGFGTSIKYSGKHLNSSITYARTLQSPAFIEDENETIYFSLSYKFSDSL